MSGMIKKTGDAAAAQWLHASSAPCYIHLTAIGGRQKYLNCSVAVGMHVVVQQLPTKYLVSAIVPKLLHACISCCCLLVIDTIVRPPRVVAFRTSQASLDALLAVIYVSTLCMWWWSCRGDFANEVVKSPAYVHIWVFIEQHVTNVHANHDIFVSVLNLSYRLMEH